jgi:peptide/nickel transport system substrate-binding protein
MPRGTSISTMALLATMVFTSACAGTAPDRPAAHGVPAPEQQPVVPKVLTVGIQVEPRSFLTIGLGGLRGGSANVLQMVNEFMVMEDDKGNYQPRLAAEPISLEKGTWRINADGTMDTVWKLRPNIKWHDGTPFTADDLVFTFDVYKDPASGVPLPSKQWLVSSSAPDPLTFVMNWSTVTAEADHGDIAIASVLPKHLLGDLFAQGDRPQFEASPYHAGEFVGVGAYRIQKWERGSHIELARFDDYYQGPARIDRIIVRFIADPNAMVSNILSGTVDALLPVAVDLDAALEVKRRWEGTGNQVRFDMSGTLPHLLIQYRPELVHTRDGLTTRSVRQGLYQAIDRQALTELMTHGLAPVADSWISPTNALRPEVQASIPQFPFDPSAAQQLLSQAGWVRGADGTLTHTQTGERFEIEVRGNQGIGDATERHLSAIAASWKAVGAQVDLNVVPAARVDDREYQVTFPHVMLYSSIPLRFIVDHLHSRQIPTASNRWSGFNRGGYVNPQVDAALDKLQSTIDPRARLPLHRELLQVQMGDVPLMPLYWEVAPILMVDGVTIPTAAQFATTGWDIMRWDKR